MGSAYTWFNNSAVVGQDLKVTKNNILENRALSLILNVLVRTIDVVFMEAKFVFVKKTGPVE